MNANEIINDDMSLDEKLKAIDDAIAKAKEAREPKASFDKVQRVEVDPMDALMCEGCQ